MSASRRRLVLLLLVPVAAVAGDCGTTASSMTGL